jgi:hypothetical protein
VPQLILYRGRPVKRRRRMAGGLCLTFYTSEPGQRGTPHFVSQADWDRHSSLQFFAREQMPDVRALVSRFPIDS